MLKFLLKILFFILLGFFLGLFLHLGGLIIFAIIVIAYLTRGKKKVRQGL